MRNCYRMDPKLDLYVSEDGRVFQEGNTFAPPSLNSKLRTTIKDTGSYRYFMLKERPIVLKEGVDYLSSIKDRTKRFVF